MLCLTSLTLLSVQSKECRNKQNFVLVLFLYVHVLFLAFQHVPVPVPMFLGTGTRTERNISDFAPEHDQNKRRKTYNKCAKSSNYCFNMDLIDRYVAKHRGNLTKCTEIHVLLLQNKIGTWLLCSCSCSLLFRNI